VPEQAAAADGRATVETYTVVLGRDGTRTGFVVGRLDADGRRFVARAGDGDEDMLALLGSEQPAGQRVFAHSSGSGNRVTTTPHR